MIVESPFGIAKFSQNTKEGAKKTNDWVDTKIVDYDDDTRRAYTCFEQRQKKVIDSFLPTTFYAQCVNPENVGKRNITGLDRLAALRWVLKTLPVLWVDYQEEFVNRMTATIAPLLFRDDLTTHLEDLLDELGFDELHSELMALMPRRFGKTVIVQAFAVAVLFAIENVQIGVFATCQRIAQKLLEGVYQFICLVPGMKDMIVRHTAEMIWIQGPCGPSDVRKISCYPSNFVIDWHGDVVVAQIAPPRCDHDVRNVAEHERSPGERGDVVNVKRLKVRSRVTLKKHSASRLPLNLIATTTLIIIITTS